MEQLADDILNETIKYKNELKRIKKMLEEMDI